MAVACGDPTRFSDPAAEGPAVATPPTEAQPVEPELAVGDVGVEPFDWSACGPESGLAPGLAPGPELGPDGALPWERVRLEPGSVATSAKATLVEDEFRLSAVPVLRAQPHASACLRSAFETEAQPSRLILAASAAVGMPAARVPLADEGADRALAALCGGPCPERRAGTDAAAVKAALSAILWALVDADAVLRARADPVRGEAWWATWGSNGLLVDPSPDAHYNAAALSDRTFLAADRGALYGAAYALTRAIEAVDWEGVARLPDPSWAVDTPQGAIAVFGADDDVHAEGERWLLAVELGGDDRYLNAVGSAGPDQRLGVLIDLGGDDEYTYPEAVGADPDRPLPADRAGRHSFEPHAVLASRSTVGRQGAGWGGIGLLYDLGSGHDVYRSLRGSQGYGGHGVGVLYDAGGDDRYQAEVASQGVGQYGLGLLVDGGGNDTYRSLSKAQGHGFVGGVGWLQDVEGDDRYRCGSDQGVVYPSAQRPDADQVSLCQGAGFGFRSDRPEYALSGGLGVLIDEAGNDAYQAEVYGQGVGYWQGFGLLWDRGGSDRYRSVYYGQGAGVHYGVGLVWDEQGDDDWGGDAAPLVVGTGHDYGVGVVIEAGGSDRHHVGPGGGGYGSCGGLGLLLELDGADRYRAGGGNVLGAASAGGCLGTPTRGFFLDAAGADVYQGVEAADGATWGAPEPLMGVGRDTAS
jgi:hypothetical protein